MGEFVQIQELIPQHKSDFERVNLLKQQPLKNLRPILSELLVWLQDENWPIAKDIEDLVLGFGRELIPHIRYIFNTNDGCWKYFVLEGLVRRLPNNILLELKEDLERIQVNPTKDEKMKN
ncbi:DUF5071 domain-containing protein [Clostridium perfringens]